MNPLRVRGSVEMVFKQKTGMLIRENTRGAPPEELGPTERFLLLI